MNYLILPEVLDSSPMGVVQDVHTLNFGNPNGDLPVERPEDYHKTEEGMSEIAALSFCLYDYLITLEEFNHIYSIIIKDGLYSQFN